MHKFTLRRADKVDHLVKTENAFNLSFQNGDREVIEEKKF
jgi:hypothetical protein